MSLWWYGTFIFLNRILQSTIRRLILRIDVSITFSRELDWEGTELLQIKFQADLQLIVLVKMLVKSIVQVNWLLCALQNNWQVTDKILE